MNEVIQLAQALIQRPSLSPDDAGCQEMLKTELQKVGFDCTDLIFDDTTNLWATHGTGSPVFVFAGHTDVVSTGDESLWDYPPFSGQIEGDRLYGRGSADMKGEVAAMILSAVNFVRTNPQHQGTIAFLITSDEEDSGKNGTKKVVEWLRENNQAVDYCLVGEPSCQKTLGDMIKNGRRGSLIGYLKIFGKQGHVAYPHLAKNPIHLALPLLEKLKNHEWDKGFDSFPPTSFQLTNIHAGDGSTNVIPPWVEIQFNWRYSPAVTHEQIQTQVESWLKEFGLNYEIRWHLSGKPFFTPEGKFTQVVQKAVFDHCGIEGKLDTGGGTSDGRFIAILGCDVVELGAISERIHQINEWTSCKDLIQLEKIYQQILEEMLKDE